MGGRVGHLDPGQFGVSLVAGSKDDHLGSGSQGEQDRAGIDNRSESAAPAPALGPGPCRRRAPGGLAALGVDAEQLVALCQAVEQAVLEHRRVELDGLLDVRPEFVGREGIAPFLELHRFGATTRPAVEKGLAIDDWGGRVVSAHPAAGIRGLPEGFSIGNADGDDVLVRFGNDRLDAAHREQNRRGVCRAVTAPLPLFVAGGQIVTHDRSTARPAKLGDAEAVHNER